MKIISHKILTILLVSASMSISALDNTNVGIDANKVKNKGYEIAAKNDHSDLGFGDSQVDMTMILRNSQGMENTRTLVVKTFEIINEDVGDKSIILFKSPADVDGTILLSHSKILDADSQWLYLPSLKRTKRISTVNKSGPFLGSEFAFEDLTSSELKKYDYQFLRTEKCGDMECDVIQRIPKYQYSGYSKQEAWIDQKYFQLRKVEFFDRREELLKTLIYDDYRTYENKYMRAHKLFMKNNKTGKSTELTYSEFNFNVGLKEKDFVKKALRRIN